LGPNNDFDFAAEVKRGRLLMSEPQPSKGEPAVRINAIWVAEQFAAINTTLLFMKDALQTAAKKEAAQDVVIEELRRDISGLRSDVRSLKEAKPTKVSPFVIVTAVVASSGFVLALLNQLYGA
jgi:hypothetical protein